MRKVINWTARRAGGRITVDGIETFDNVNGLKDQPIKIVGVDRIAVASNGLVIAVHKDGESFVLVAG